MKGKIILGVIFGFFFAGTAFGLPPTQIRYRAMDLGSGRWQYIYDITNHSLVEGIEEFTIWFDYGLYDNLAVETLDPPTGDWNEIVWQPEPEIGGDGGYDGLVEVWASAIGTGQTVSNFAVSFNWLGSGQPGPQDYEIVDPLTFVTIDSADTMLATLMLLDINSGEDLEAGKTFPLMWLNTGSTTEVLLGYSADNGSSWVTIDTSVTGATGTYDWTVPAIGSLECLVRVSDVSNSSVFDVIDAPFKKIWEKVYVDPNALGSNDGTSWTNAYNHLQDALANVSGSCVIRVAEGIYKPDNATFQLINGVVIKGGYAGYGEPDPNARDIQAHETILRDGYHVVTGAGHTSVLDGVTVTGGNAGSGGGIYGGSSTIINCTIIGNSAYGNGSRGGGMYNCNGPITKCIISGNSASYSNSCCFSAYGGGMYNCNGPITDCTISENLVIRGNNLGDKGNGGGMYECDGPITNCTIAGNQTPDRGGGLYQCDGPITNCTIIGNSASHGGSFTWGGGMYECDGPITNCTISGNSAFPSSRSNGGIYNCDGPITNSIIWGNSGGAILGSTPAIRYSDVQSGFLGEGNINVDPLFSLPSENDYHLLPNSPCIDAGDPNSPWEVEPWSNGARVNMGAYGNTPEATISGWPLQFAGFKIIEDTRLARTIFRYDLSLSLTNISNSNMVGVRIEVVYRSPQIVNVVDNQIIFPLIEANSTVDSNDIGDYFTIDIDRSEPIGAGRLTWRLDYTEPQGAAMQMMSMSFTESDFGLPAVAGDVTGEGIYDTEDLIIMARDWLQSGSIADIYPPPPDGDDIVNLLDFAVLALHWMEGVTP